MRLGITVMFVLGASLPGAASAAPIAPLPDAPDVSSALSAGQLDLRTIAGGLSAPVGVTNAGDGTNRLFVVERRGTVRVVKSGALQAGFFLDIRTNSQGGLSSGGEQGLLGLAFHPDFESNEKLFVYFTRADGDLVIAEMTANAARTSANVSTLNPIIAPIEHSAFGNHNGGQLLFVGDHLYIFTGDGGSGGDPAGNAQNPNSRLGKVLRVTPNLSGGVTIPSDNPYVGVSGDDAVWAIGLRNPWRASRDGATGNLWIADVGQNELEEINREPASTAGRDYGWDDCEGTEVFTAGQGPCPSLGQASGSRQAPIAQYSHSFGCSITGGHVYRGSGEPDLVGHYVLADFCSGRLWTISAGGSTLVFHRDTSRSISSFGESESGEVYAVDIANGKLYLVIAPPYSDITNSFFYSNIKWLHENSITGGCGGGRFCPTASVTRGQMASFIARAMDLPATSTDFFTDDESSIHENDINRLAAAGITGGCGQGKFCPSVAVKRGPMASFLARALDLPPTANEYFTDDNDSIHEDNINRVRRAGIAGGCAATLYCPGSIVTREQMAAFLHRAFD